MKVFKKGLRKIFSLYSSVLIFLKKMPPKKVLIVGHMRSGSSLLTHILIDNPEITGIGETHTRYDNKYFTNALAASLMAKMRVLHFPGNSTYLMDKVLHNYILDESILKDKHTLLILLVRSPEQCIPSILNLFKKSKKPFTGKNACSYYVNRLNYMIDIKSKYNSKCFFIDYSDFLINNENTLKELSAFLSLKEPLNSSYKLNKFTGKPRIGDPSKNIMSGKILTKGEKKELSFDFSDMENEFKEAKAMYNKIKVVCNNNINANTGA